MAQTARWAAGFLLGLSQAYRQGSVPLTMVQAVIKAANRCEVPESEIAAILLASGLRYDAESQTATPSHG
jgi:hypothetical protein